MKLPSQQQREAKRGKRSITNLFISFFFFGCFMAIFTGSGLRIIECVGISMEPSVKWGTWEVLAPYQRFESPRRGDIVVLISPINAHELYEKRVIGLPGDTITINNTQVIVNGVTLSEPYVSSMLQGNPNSNTSEHWTVPRGEFFVMGDDRAFSFDSRAFGFVRRQNILWHVVFILWPIGSNWGMLPDESAVFEGV